MILKNQVIFKGNRCFDQCGKGPNLKIDDKMFHQINENNVEIILDQFSVFSGSIKAKKMEDSLVKINIEKCVLCYACVRNCPVKAIAVSSNEETPIKVIYDRCVGLAVRATKFALTMLLNTHRI
jgi:ferredoxin